jgi:hypothetical protein
LDAHGKIFIDLRPYLYGQIIRGQDFNTQKWGVNENIFFWFAQGDAHVGDSIVRRIGSSSNPLLDPNFVAKRVPGFIEYPGKKGLHLAVRLLWQGAVDNPSIDIFRIGLKNRMQVLLDID